MAVEGVRICRRADTKSQNQNQKRLYCQVRFYTYEEFVVAKSDMDTMFLDIHVCTVTLIVGRVSEEELAH